jgi:hypothetical protein
MAPTIGDSLLHYKLSNYFNYNKDNLGVNFVLKYHGIQFKLVYNKKICILMK